MPVRPLADLVPFPLHAGPMGSIKRFSRLLVLSSSLLHLFLILPFHAPLMHHAHPPPTPAPIAAPIAALPPIAPPMAPSAAPPIAPYRPHRRLNVEAAPRPRPDVPDR